MSTEAHRVALIFVGIVWLVGYRVGVPRRSARFTLGVMGCLHADTTGELLAACVSADPR